MQKIVSLCLFLSFQLSAFSPRILIKLDCNSVLTIGDLTKELEAHVIYSQTGDDFQQQINTLDTSSDNHRIILDGPVEDLRALAGAVGYDVLKLETDDIVSACKAIAQKEKTIPLTDADLPSMDAKKIGRRIVQ